MESVPTSIAESMATMLENERKYARRWALLDAAMWVRDGATEADILEKMQEELKQEGTET